MTAVGCESESCNIIWSCIVLVQLYWLEAKI